MRVHVLSFFLNRNIYAVRTLEALGRPCGCVYACVCVTFFGYIRMRLLRTYCSASYIVYSISVNIVTNKITNHFTSKKSLDLHLKRCRPNKSFLFLYPLFEFVVVL